MKTNPEIYLYQAAQKNLQLRSKLEQVRGNISVTVHALQRDMAAISESLRIEYTGFAALFKEFEGGWKCLAVVDTDNLPDDMPESWDLVMPIPKPESMPEFSGW